MSTKARLVLVLLALGAVVLLILTSLTGDEAGVALVVAEVIGPVSLLGGQGEALTIGPGTRLSAHQRVATGPDARAVLALGDETRVRLGPESSVTVRSVDAEVVRLELEDGRLQATVRPSSGALSVTAGGREVLATDADLAMAVSGEVEVIQVDRGEAALVGVQGVRALERGERLTLRGDADPQLGAIPEDLLLTVRWPGRNTREDSVAVSGATEPGAAVQVRSGATLLQTQADRDGAFSVVLPLVEGHNPVEIEATGVMGDYRELAGSVERDTKGPVFGGAIEYSHR
ncbi:MAG: FecR domain-containing protein [Deltaproteobacteria bacterium]|nr:FecR domain-containing protein [Deltaproteobacteria bacterium]